MYFFLCEPDKLCYFHLEIKYLTKIKKKEYFWKNILLYLFGLINS